MTYPPATHPPTHPLLPTSRTQGLNWNFTRWAYPLAVGILFFAPQDRDHNFVLNFFWCWWWPLVLVAYPFVARVWCAVCPFMIYGEWAQKVKLSMGGTVAHWPKARHHKRIIKCSLFPVPAQIPRFFFPPRVLLLLGAPCFVFRCDCKLQIERSKTRAGPTISSPPVTHQSYKIISNHRSSERNSAGGSSTPSSPRFSSGRNSGCGSEEDGVDYPHPSLVKQYISGQFPSAQDLDGTAYLSGWLLLLITAGACVVFDQKITRENPRPPTSESNPASLVLWVDNSTALPARGTHLPAATQAPSGAPSSLSAATGAGTNTHNPHPHPPTATPITPITTPITNQSTPQSLPNRTAHQVPVPHRGHERDVREAVAAGAAVGQGGALCVVLCCCAASCFMCCVFFGGFLLGRRGGAEAHRLEKDGVVGQKKPDRCLLSCRMVFALLRFDAALRCAVMRRLRLRFRSASFSAFFHAALLRQKKQQSMSRGPTAHHHAPAPAPRPTSLLTPRPPIPAPKTPQYPQVCSAECSTYHCIKGGPAEAPEGLEV